MANTTKRHDVPLHVIASGTNGFDVVWIRRKPEANRTAKFMVGIEQFAVYDALFFTFHPIDFNVSPQFWHSKESNLINPLEYAVVPP